jgi:hypothetical protein
MNRLGSALVLALAFVCAPAAWGQASNDELRELRAELQRLREEVAALRKELRDSRPVPEAAGPGAAAAQEVSPAAQMEMLRAQVEEQAQTKVESTSRWPVRVFGALVSNTFFNAGTGGEADWIDNPTLVVAPAAGMPKGSFSSSMRQTRLGALIDGPSIAGMRSSAVVAVDFFGAIPQFDSGPVIGQPRLLYAYARLQGERTALQIGQDHMLFAPNNPTSLAAMSFPGLYRTGNLYVRYPQVRLEHRRNTGSGTWLLAGGVLAPLGGAPVAPGTFVHANFPGERSMHPAFQGRAAWRAANGNRAFELGASGHLGRLRLPLSASTQESWGFSVDFDARAGRLGIGGEAFVGENLAAMGGAAGQFARSAGGFIEGRWKATERMEVNGGFGTDRLFDSSAASAPIRYFSNASIFGNFIYRFTPELETSVEYRWLATEPLSGILRHNNHVNLAFVYRF